MEKLKSLNRFQKSVLLFVIAMALVFAVIYSLTISKVGFEYKNTIFIPDQKNGFTVYSGKIQGKQAYFTVSEDKTVVFQCGDKTYGPYTAKEEPSAVPENQEIAEYMTGVELRQGEEIMFRGGDLGNISDSRCQACGAIGLGNCRKIYRLDCSVHYGVGTLSYRATVA